MENGHDMSCPYNPSALHKRGEGAHAVRPYKSRADTQVCHYGATPSPYDGALIVTARFSLESVDKRAKLLYSHSK
jgi:hypothetical protein